MKTPLYSKPIKGLNHNVKDLRAIAFFNRIVLNYLKMRKIQEKNK